MFVNHPKVHGEQNKHTVDPCGLGPLLVSGNENSIIDNHDASVLPRKSKKEILKLMLGPLFPESTRQEVDTVIWRAWMEIYLPT